MRRDQDGVRAGGGPTELCTSVVASSASTAAAAAATGTGGRGGGLRHRGGLHRDGRFHGGEAADADLLRPRDGDPAAAEVVRREQPPLQAAGERDLFAGLSFKVGPQVW